MNIPQVVIAIMAVATLSIRTASAVELDVAVRGFRNEHGQAVVQLYESAAEFPKHPARRVYAPIDPKTLSVEIHFTAVTSGSIAIAAFHDENGNGRLDRNLFGKPTEPVGFTNGAKAGFGPPPFATAKIELHPGLNQVVVEVVSL